MSRGQFLPPLQARGRGRIDRSGRMCLFLPTEALFRGTLALSPLPMSERLAQREWLSTIRDETASVAKLKQAYNARVAALRNPCLPSNSLPAPAHSRRAR